MPTPPGYADCSYELKHASLSRAAFITFGVDVVETDPAAVATALVGAFAAPGSLFAIIDTNVTMVRARASLGTDGGEDNVGVSVTSSSCNYSGTTIWANTSALVHKRSTRGGRRGRGRMYIPWCLPTSGVSEVGVITGAEVTRIQNGVNAWMAALSSGAGPLVLLHRPSNPGTAHPTTPGVPNNVTAMVVDPLVGTQRRRLGR